MQGMEPSPLRLSGSTLEVPARPRPVFSSSPTGDEGRTFRRYPLLQEAGVQLAAESAPHRLADASAGGHPRAHGLCYRSVVVRDLSLTGLYFLTTLPYRVGCRLEIQLPLTLRTLHLPATVRRLVPPAPFTPGGPPETFGCGVDFLFSQMAAPAKQGLMEFLTQRFSPISVVPNPKRAN